MDSSEVWRPEETEVPERVVGPLENLGRRDEGVKGAAGGGVVAVAFAVRELYCVKRETYVMWGAKVLLVLKHLHDCIPSIITLGYIDAARRFVF